jgi:DNA mismatch repair protein MLH1
MICLDNSISEEEGRIRPLAEEVVNKIAAGEIIQRPSNAVKELLDNSMDAGATSVSVLVKEGGMRLLQVQDNGSGIHSDDLCILCQRHTTSKLSTFDDLKGLATLGFRGEALSSMSYVSHLTVTTKRRGDPHAWRAAFDSGRVVEGYPSPSAGVDGTTVTVEDLFFNVPMRKKAIRSASDEYNSLLDVVQRYAVFHAGVSVSLRRVGTSAADVHTQQGHSRKDAIRNVYGASVSSNLKELTHGVDEGLEGVKMEGWMTGPGYTSLKKTKLILFVNGRCVESATLRRCIESVYGVLLPKGTKPFVFLSISMPLHWVDVNIHPTKSEVAMLHEEDVCDLLRRTVEKTLLESEDTRVLSVGLIPGLARKEGEPSTSLPATASNKMQSTVRTQRPEKMVRVDTQSQTLEELLSMAPSRRSGKGRRAPLDLSLVSEDVHDGLKDILRHNTVVGWVDSTRVLVQKGTRLYLLDVAKLSRDLFLSLAVSKQPSTSYSKVTMRPPANVTDLLLIALEIEGNKKDQSAAEVADINAEVAALLCQLLAKHAEYLEDTFGVVLGRKERQSRSSLSFCMDTKSTLLGFQTLSCD